MRGPALDVAREPDGSLSALGFHTKTPVKGRTRELPPQEPTQIKLAKIELERCAAAAVTLPARPNASAAKSVVQLSTDCRQNMEAPHGLRVDGIRA